MADQASAVPFDEAPVTTRYWLSIILFAVTGVVDFFDFFVVGFLVSVLAPKWHLTFGQTSIMLMSAGIGAMLGALASGFLADRFGRKPLTVAGVLICGLRACSGTIAANGGLRSDGVVPVAVELVAKDVDGVHLVIGDFDACRIGVPINFGSHF